MRFGRAETMGFDKRALYQRLFSGERPRRIRGILAGKIFAVELQEHREGYRRFRASGRLLDVG